MTEAPKEVPKKDPVSGVENAAKSGRSVSVDAAGNAAVKSGGTSASVSSSGGASLNSGSLSVGLMELDGESVTRISYRPELEFGKLGVALDIELFIDSDGNFKSEGWEFDSRDQILNTLYRKIYYVRWDQPGAPFYARVGALEGLNFDAAGLVMIGWGNVANYPSQKLLGVHTQINETMTPLAMSLDVATNSALDWNKGGGVLATKLGIAPLTSLSIPIISDLRLQGVMVSDFNQKAAVPDRDEDGCPDDLDANTDRGQVCSSPNLDVTQLPSGDQERLQYISEFEEQLAAEDKRIKDDFAIEDPFTMISIEALLPIISSEFFELNVFAEAAKPWDEKDLDDAWAVVPVGASGHLSIFQYGLQYRIMDGEFYPGHFDAAYEMQRMTFDNGRYISKQELFWSEDLGKRKGIYGSLGANLWDVAGLSGSYSHLMAEKSRYSKVDSLRIKLPDDKSFSVSAGLGQSILSYIPKISQAEIFYSKTRIGQDFRLEYTDESPDKLSMATDSFFQKSRFTTWGFTIGSDLGGGLQLNVTRATTFERISTGKGSSELVPNDNFYAETVLSF